MWNVICEGWSIHCRHHCHHQGISAGLNEQILTKFYIKNSCLNVNKNNDTFSLQSNEADIP